MRLLRNIAKYRIDFLNLEQNEEKPFELDEKINTLIINKVLLDLGDYIPQEQVKQTSEAKKDVVEEKKSISVGMSITKKKMKYGG